MKVAVEKDIQLVTMKQAKRLKDEGFNWETQHFYNILCNSMLGYDRGTKKNWNNVDVYFSAPSAALALKWFRDVKGRVGVVEFQLRYRYSYTTPKKGGKYSQCFSDYFDTYEAAESALLDELLEIVDINASNRSERAREIANETLRQLGGNKFIAMTGAENLAYNDLASNGDVDLTFTIGKNDKRVKHVLVRYDYGKDLYVMKFYTEELTLVAEYDEVYCDMLGDIFESVTGMYTSL